MSERSIRMVENFQNLSTRAVLMEKKGDAKAAAELRAKAEKVATETDLNQLGYTQLAAKKTAEAIVTFEKNVKAHPESWNAHDSLAEAYAATGKR